MYVDSQERDIYPQKSNGYLYPRYDLLQIYRFMTNGLRIQIIHQF